MKINHSDLKALKENYPENKTIKNLINWYLKTEPLLERALYEFGSELRNEIEEILEEDPLIHQPSSFDPS